MCVSVFNPKTPGRHGLFLSRDLSNSEIQQRAIKRCRIDLMPGSDRQIEITLPKTDR